MFRIYTSDGAINISSILPTYSNNQMVTISIPSTVSPGTYTLYAVAINRYGVSNATMISGQLVVMPPQPSTAPLPSPTLSSIPTATVTPTDDDTTSSNVGAIVGGVVGGIAAVAIIAAIVIAVVVTTFIMIGKKKKGMHNTLHYHNVIYTICIIGSMQVNPAKKEKELSQFPLNP